MRRVASLLVSFSVALTLAGSPVEAAAASPSPPPPSTIATPRWTPQQSFLTPIARAPTAAARALAPARAFVQATTGRPAAPPASGLPASASPLMRHIYDAVRPTTAHGTVPARLVAFEDYVETRAFVGGPQGFGRMANLISGARHEVLLETYLWQKSDVASTVLGSLKDLQRNLAADPSWNGEPVKVRILVNQRAGWLVPIVSAAQKVLPAKFERATDRFSGAKQLVENQLAELGLDPKLVDARVEVHTMRGLGALHSKTLVVDGRSVVATGMNVQRSNDALDDDGHAKLPSNDAAFVMHGAAVGAALRADFADGWKRATGEALHELPNQAVAAASTSAPADTVKAPMLLVTRRPTANPLSNRTDDPHDQAFIAALHHAESEVHLLSPNLNDDAIKSEILRAVARGIVVKIVLGKGFNDGSERLPLQGGTNAHTAKDLYERLARNGLGDAFGRLQIKWYSHDGEKPIEGASDGRSHLKYQSIDGQVAIVGSGNLDTQSLNHSQEANVVVDSRRVVAAWESQIFEPAFTRGIVVEPPKVRGAP